MPGCWTMPSTAATASGTAVGSVTAANSTSHTPSGKSLVRECGDLHRQPRLADAADPGECDQAVIPDRGDAARPDRRRGREDVSPVAADCPPPCRASSAAGTRWAGRPRAPGTPRPGRRCRVIASCPATIRSTSPTRPAVGAVQEDLPAVAGGHQPRHPVEHRAEVVAVAVLGLARRDAHAHRQLQRALRGDGGVDGGAAGS